MFATTWKMKLPLIYCWRSLHMKRGELYKECFRILGVDESSDQDTVRRAYIEIVKKVHPDSGQPEASNERFQQVDEAFKMLQEKFAKNRRNIFEDEDETVDFDIRHTAPQHRQYLGYDGVGVGNPFQRQKQYQQVKAMKAQERVFKHRLDKSQAGERTIMKKGGTYFRNHAIKTKYGFERVVEDLIQEAMSKGDFNNLSGAGKPLSEAQSQNPYLDFTTHKLNKILLDNGFTPEWITLSRDIRDGIRQLKQKMREERSYYGDNPLSEQEQISWSKFVQRFDDDIQQLNVLIDKHNLIVPILKNQFFRLKLDIVADNILQEDRLARKMRRSASCDNAPDQAQTSDTKSNLFSFIGSLF